MKNKLFLLMLVTGFSFVKADAQYVRSKPGFSVNLSIGSRERVQHRGSVWVGPEWEWRGDRYVEIPGHWERERFGSRWIPGHWAGSRRGYRWIPGHWR